MSGHTPPPWQAVLDNDPRGQPVSYYRGLIALVERGDRTLAVVLGPGHPNETVPQEQWEPNAKLIAAAPVLADRLLARVEACCCDETSGPCEDCTADRAALRLAGRL